MRGLQVSHLPDGRKAIIIRTSDRIAFKQCRRKWGWSSHLKQNLGSKQLAAPLWFGSAIHYALEDYHGWNKFGHPKEAFKAYCIATAKNHLRDLPSDAQEHYILGQRMMEYYVEYFLQKAGRKVYQTYWAPNPITGDMEPQVEVNFEIPIPIPADGPLRAYCDALGVDVVLYRGTLDRVCIDDDGCLWVDEYKTAKILTTMHYATDPQVTTYLWATSLIYDMPVAGVIYEQFVKKAPSIPSPLSGTGRLSTAQNFVTSYPLYKTALEGMYGDVTKAPSKNQDFLNQLAKQETEDRDRFIVRDRIRRNNFQLQHESWKILMELEDMLNPNLPMYPNPTRECSRMCNFLSPCISMDDGSDWEQALEANYASRDQDADRLWRARLPSPTLLLEAQNSGSSFDVDEIHAQALLEQAQENKMSDEAWKAAEIDAGQYPAAEWDMSQQEGYDPWKGMNSKGAFNMNEVN